MALGMVFSHHHFALLVADGKNHRILVVNPGDGSVRHVVQFSPEMGVIANLCLYQGQIIVHHNDAENEKVSLLSLGADNVFVH